MRLLPFALLVGTSLLLAPRAHAREKLPPGQSKLLLKVAPETTVVEVDGKRRGTAAEVKELLLPPGPHIVHLVHGLDEHEDQVVLRKGAVTSFEWKFEDDRKQPPKAEEPAEGAAPAAEPSPSP